MLNITTGSELRRNGRKRNRGGASRRQIVDGPNVAGSTLTGLDYQVFLIS